MYMYTCCACIQGNADIVLARGGLAGKCTKVAYTKGVALLHIPLFLRGGWLKENSVQRHGGRVAYTSEYGICIFVYISSNVRVSASIQLPSGSEFSLELDLLHPVVAEKSIVKILSTKVGFIL